MPENRFDWWNAQPPDTSPFTGGNDPAALIDLEFCSPLATVVGADLTEIPPSFTGTLLPWDVAIAARNGSPNDMPGLDFVVRGALPESTTALIVYPLDVGGEIRNEVVAINSQGGVQTIDPLQSSLFIDFVVPQRAVALEYGFLSGEGPGLRLAGGDVQLIAFDRDGNILVSSSATQTDPLSPGLAPDTVTYVIGLHHLLGAISTVELRFRLPNDPREEPHPDYLPQLVRRIWHEPLPPAAVLQGTVAADFNRMPPDGPGPYLPALPDELSAPPNLKWPFRCDRAVVMLRGFRIEFLDEASREVNAIAVGIDAPTLFARERHPGINFAPTGRIGAWTRGPTGTRVQIYYTVVAWDSEQSEVFAAKAAGLTAGSQDFGSEWVVQTLDPFPDSYVLGSGADPSQTRGPLFGSLARFSFELSGASSSPPPTQEIDRIWLVAGEMGGGKCGVDDSSIPTMVAPIVPDFPDLGRVGGGVNWFFCSVLKGGGLDYENSVGGAVLTGRSVHLGTVGQSFGIPVPTAGPRRNPDDFLATPPLTPTLAVEGDVAFLGMSMFYFEPKGKVRELEVELRAIDFDGTGVSWELGGGIQTETIGSGQPNRTVFALPTWGAFGRNPGSRLSTQQALFTGVVGTLTSAPDRFGVLRNDSSYRTLVSGAEMQGPNADEFFVRLEHRGHTLYWTELAGRPPLELLPGEAITIGGLFLPNAAAGPRDPPRSAQIVFQNTSLSPRAAVDLLGRTEDAAASGRLIPDIIDFAEVRGGVPTPVRRNALVLSTGLTPLFVQAPTLENENLGFSIAGWEGATTGIVLGGVNGFLIDPGNAMLVHLMFNPTQQGFVQTHLVVQTNDMDPARRRLSVTLNGAGI